MALNLATLDVAIRATGTREVARELGAVDKAGQQAASGAQKAERALDTMARGAVRDLTGVQRQAAATTTTITTMGATLTRADLTAALAPVVTELAAMSAQLGTATGALTGLAAASAETNQTLGTSAGLLATIADRIEDVGRETPPTTARVRGLALAFSQIGRAGNLAGLDAIGRQIETFSAGAGIAATRGQSLKELARLEGMLQAQVAGGTLRIRERIRVEQQLAAIRTAREGAATPGLFTGVGSTLRATAGVLGITAGIGAVAGTLARITRATDDAEAAQRKLLATSKLTGQALGTIRGFAAQAERDFALSASAAADLTQALVKLTGRAGDVAQTGDVMLRWLDLAAAQGLTASEALQTIETTLIGQDEGLNRLGLANPQQIYEKWGRAAGVSAAKMTEAQKAQAIINAVVEAGTKVQGAYADSLNEVAGGQARLSQEVDRTAVAYGKMLEPVRRGLLDAATATVKWLGEHRALVAALGTATVAVGTLALAWKGYTVAVAAASVAQMALSRFMLTSLTAVALNPVVLGLAAVGAVVAKFAYDFFKAKREAVAFFDSLESMDKKQLDAESTRLQAELEALTRERERLEAKKEQPQGAVGGSASETFALSKAIEGDLKRVNDRIAETRDRLNAVLDQKLQLEEATRAANAAPTPSTGTGSEKRKLTIDDEIAALESLREHRTLTTEEMARAAEIERLAGAERDRLSEKTRRTADETVRLAEATERAARAHALLTFGNIHAGRKEPEQRTDVESPGRVRPNEEVLFEEAMRGSTIPIDTERRRAEIEQAGKDLEAAAQQAGMNVGMAFANAIGAGFAAIGAGADFGDAILTTLLSGLGAALQSFGAALIAASGIMAKALAAFASLNPVAMAAAGAALIALGGFISGAAQRAVGGGGGRSGGGWTAPQNTTTTIPLGTGARAAGGATATGSAVQPTSAFGGRPVAAAPVERVVMPVTIIGPNDPVAQRQLMQLVKKANHRGL